MKFIQIKEKSSYGQSGASHRSYRSDYGSGRIGVTVK